MPLLLKGGTELERKHESMLIISLICRKKKKNIQNWCIYKYNNTKNAKSILNYRNDKTN